MKNVKQDRIMLYRLPNKTLHLTWFVVEINHLL